ncbi:MAG: hypothetical protein AB2532_06800, partial [Candidatus Thiodiazotropha sp.]
MEQKTTANPGKVAFLTVLRRSSNFHRIQSFQLIARGYTCDTGQVSALVCQRVSVQHAVCSGFPQFMGL